MRSRCGDLFVLPHFLEGKLKAPCYVGEAELGREHGSNRTQHRSAKTCLYPKFMGDPGILAHWINVPQSIPKNTSQRKRTSTRGKAGRRAGGRYMIDASLESDISLSSNSF